MRLSDCINGSHRDRLCQKTLQKLGSSIASGLSMLTGSCPTFFAWRSVNHRLPKHHTWPGEGHKRAALHLHKFGIGFLQQRLRAKLARDNVSADCIRYGCVWDFLQRRINPCEIGESQFLLMGRRRYACNASVSAGFREIVH